MKLALSLVASSPSEAGGGQVSALEAAAWHSTMMIISSQMHANSN